MYQSIKVITCAFALTLSGGSFAMTNIGPEQLYVAHMAQHMRPGQKGVVRCVKAIQQHWDRRAKLMLDMRATLRETDTKKVLLVGGAVWENGERVRVEHECSTSKSTQQFALQVRSADQSLIASQ